MDGLILHRWSLQKRSQFKLPQEAYSYHTLLCAEDGAFSFALGGSERGTARFGDIVTCPPDTLFQRQMQTAHVTFLFAAFSVEGKAIIPTGKRAVSDPRRLATTLAGFRRLPWGDGTNPWAVHLVRDLLYLLLAPTLRADPETLDPLMAEAARRLRDAKSPPLTQIAQQLHLSPSQLTRRFAFAYHTTPSQFQADVRLQKARALLLETDDTLEHIARVCGYRDGFYLSRVFRRQMGMPPSVFRKNSRV